MNHSIYNEIVKLSGDVNEPSPESHASAPEQKLRPRAEVVIYNKDGVWGMKKDGYLLLPGGGIPEGEKPAESAVREALEEADRVCHNLESRNTASAVYDPDVIKVKDWDGEKTWFFIALDGGSGGMHHKDKEAFRVIPYEDALSFLTSIINDRRQAWARQNNRIRKQIIREARYRSLRIDGTTPVKYATGGDGVNTQDQNKQDAPVRYGRIGALMVAPTLVGAGAVGVAAGAKVSSRTRIGLRKGLMQDLKQFKESVNVSDPNQFLNNYVTQGHNLMNEKMKYRGKVYSAHDVIRQARSNPITSALHRVGLGMSPYDAQSKVHYEAFIESPQRAYRQIIHETFPSVDVSQNMADIYKGKRSEAIARSIQGKGKLTQRDLINNTAKAVSEEIGASPDQFKSIRDSVMRTERAMYKKNPRLYRIYNARVGDAISRGDNTTLGRLDKLKERLFRDVSFGKGTPETMFQQMRSGKPPEITTTMANKYMEGRYRDYVRKGYGNFHGVFSKLRKINKGAKRFAVKAGIVGALGLGLGAYGLAGMPKEKDK